MHLKQILMTALLLAAFCLPGGAAAAESSALAFSKPASVRVSMWLRAETALRTTPASAALGVDCGLAEMCGIDPCTCGSADEWGHCSCNGTKDTPVSYKVTVADPNIADVSVSDGKLNVRGLSAGTTTVAVTAKLKHYTSATQTVTVTVAPPWYLLGLLPVAAAAAGTVWWLRKHIRGKKRRKQGEETK